MAQVQKSKLMQKIGNVGKVVKDRVEKGAQFGPARVPANVRNGVAKLTNLKIVQIAQGKPSAGEYQFIGTGVMVSPDYVQNNGTQEKVRGCQTSLFVKLCEEKFGTFGRSKDENVDAMVQQLIAFGAEELLTPDCDFEEVVKAMNARIADKAAPPIYFKVSTQAKPTEKNPGFVKEYWNGCEGLEKFTPDEPMNADGAPAAQDNTEFSEFGDLDSLVERANADDGDAQASLREKAKELGATDEALDDEEQYPSWESIAEFVKAGVAAEPAEEPWVPVKGPCKYKGKKHEIIAVQGRSKTVHLKGLIGKDKKPVAVKFDEVTEA